jgi:hypothetical protein
MKKLAARMVASMLLAPALALAEPLNEGEPNNPDNQVVKNARAGRSVGHVILFYLPNRIFDAFDIVRLRVRLGPGFAVRAHATRALDVGIGSYAGVWVGIPGPRQKVELPLPLGLESYSGIALGVVGTELAGGASPDYGVTEFGVSLHVLVAGLDIGFDPGEFVDWIAGFALLDFRGDDY